MTTPSQSSSFPLPSLSRSGSSSAEDILAQLEAAHALQHIDVAFDMLDALADALKSGKRKKIRRAMRLLENALILTERKLQDDATRQPTKTPGTRPGAGNAAESASQHPCLAQAA